jgi:hypothetical protein
MTTFAPPPPPGAPPRLTPGGRATLRALIVAAAAVLVLGGVAALGVGAWSVSQVRVAADTQTLPATMRALVLDTGDVPVAVRITSTPDTRSAAVGLRLVNTADGGSHGLTVDGDGTVARVGIEGRPSRVLDWARGGEITVTLPPDQARALRIRSEQAIGVLVAEADVEELTVRNGRGAVIVRGAAQRMEIHTVNGDISTRGAVSVSERFSASTSDGDITVDFTGAPPRVVEARSRDGRVDLGLPGPGPFLVRASSGASTRVRVPETTAPDQAVADVTARSDTGAVVVSATRD